MSKISNLWDISDLPTVNCFNLEESAQGIRLTALGSGSKPQKEQSETAELASFQEAVGDGTKRVKTLKEQKNIVGDKGVRTR